MSLQDTELKIGGVNLKGVWIAIVISIAYPSWRYMGSRGVYGRIEAVESAVSGMAKLVKS